MGSAARLEAPDTRGLGIFIPRVLALTSMGRHWPPLCGPAGLRVWTSSAAEAPGMHSLVTTDAVHSQGRLRDSQQFPLELRHATQRRRGTLSGAHPAAGFRGKPRLRRASAVLARCPLNRRNGTVPSGKGNNFVYSALRWRSLDDALHVYNAFLHMAQGKIQQWTSSCTLVWLK